MLELGLQDFQALWSGVRSSCILLEPPRMKRTSSLSQLREEDGVEHHGVILPIDVILKHERPNQDPRRNCTPHQDVLAMQSGFVNLTWMLSAPGKHILSVNVPHEVKVGLNTKPNVFQSVEVLLQMITKFLRKPSPLFSAHSRHRLEDMDLVRVHA